MIAWWTTTSGEQLAQGDYLPRCRTPVVPAEFGDRDEFTLTSKTADLVVLSQSCDLVNQKLTQVILCPAWPVTRLMAVDPQYAKPKALEPIRRGAIPTLHLLASPATPDDNLSALYLDFRQVISLPVGYLQRHAANLGERRRLASPYVEHLSQAFARFFMRVGLPSDIAPYK